MSWLQMYTRLESGCEPKHLFDLNDCYVLDGGASHVPGYLIMVYKDSSVKSLSALSLEKQIGFMSTLAVLNFSITKSIRQVDDNFIRSNLEILGNLDPYLHAHIWPRYLWEVEPSAKKSLRELGDKEKNEMESTAKSKWDANMKARLFELIQMNAQDISHK